ncbi:Transmembrane 6 superfamily member 1 [Channa argus]|uniref:Transmembrane 6 superfamily member 1 n=1 Tax=Channa argus TaxID=215402 RepID=A0A6G1PM88_CHAAH|nr:Transmembrane 6 superfamily member 1 [Channa argus]
MNNIPEFQEPYVILEIGVAVLVVVFLFYFFITRSNPPKDAFFFVFAEFSFTCVIDLVSALEYDGIISGFMEFYQKTGEPYLGTAYAIMMCYWDGIAHFIMYLMMISRITDSPQNKAENRLKASVVGISNCIHQCHQIKLVCRQHVVVLIELSYTYRNVPCKYGSEIRPAFWLNFVFLVIPAWGAITLFRRPKDRPLIGGYNAQHAQSMKLIWRPLDLILVLLLLVAMAFTILRGLVALDSPLEACSIYLRHYEPYLKDPVGYPRVMCQWAHIGGSLHPRTAAPFRIPSDTLWFVLAANLLYTAIPILVAFRVHSNPYFFLKISPFPGQTGLPYSEEKDTKYKDK